MQYVATIKKKSPMHSLWRASKQHKARFLNTLFVFNKPTGEYIAKGDLPELGRLMRHPHVRVDVMSESVEDVTTPAVQTQDPPEETKEAEQTASEDGLKAGEEKAPADAPTETNAAEVKAEEAPAAGSEDQSN